MKASPQCSYEDSVAHGAECLAQYLAFAGIQSIFMLVLLGMVRLSKPERLRFS